MTVSSETKEIGVGFVVLLGLVVGLVLSSIGGRTGGGDVFTLKASFQRIDGLALGDEVQLGGVRIGSVVEQGLSKDGYQAMVVMRIDAAIDLPRDSSAAIHTDGLFGGKLVSLSPGGEEALLRNGDTITYTQDSLVVEDLLEMIINEGRSLRKPGHEAEG